MEAPCREQLRSYDYSPRSRRRCDYSNNQDFTDYRRQTPKNTDIRTKETGNAKRSSRPRETGYDERDSRPRPDEHQKSSSNKNREKDSGRYSTRTLTERDIRHLERHLSMKKTIRKQISRNLAQAFVEDPDIILKSETPSPTKEKSSDRSFTLTRAKLSKSEQNVLELLKDNETDSGHCSADNHCSSDDEDNKKQSKYDVRNVSEEKQEIRSKKEISSKDDGKFSFWKMFSMKPKGKR